MGWLALVFPVCAGDRAHISFHKYYCLASCWRCPHSDMASCCESSKDEPYINRLVAMRSYVSIHCDDMFWRLLSHFVNWKVYHVDIVCIELVLTIVLIWHRLNTTVQKSQVNKFSWWWWHRWILTFWLTWIKRCSSQNECNSWMCIHFTLFE